MRLVAPGMGNFQGKSSFKAVKGPSGSWTLSQRGPISLCFQFIFSRATLEPLSSPCLGHFSIVSRDPLPSLKAHYHWLNIRKPTMCLFNACTAWADDQLTSRSVCYDAAKMIEIMTECTQAVTVYMNMKKAGSSLRGLAQTSKKTGSKGTELARKWDF